MDTNINCAVACADGCILGDKCPSQKYVVAASNFIKQTSLDTMLEIAEAARLKKLHEPPKWVIPDDF